MMTATDWARELSLEPEGETAAINSPRTLQARSGRGNEEKMVPHFFRMIVYMLGVG